MTRKSFVLLVMGTVIFFLCSVSSADVPSVINYQGKLTTAEGGCLNDTVSMTCTIYSDDQGTVVDWTEDQDSVIVKEGIFNVLLGSVNPITASVFDGSIKYLGVQVESDPEMRPLKPMVTTGYAFRSQDADTAEYARAAPAMPDDDWVISGDDIYRLTGNVGIGTATPADKLDITGNVHASGTISSGTSLILDGTNDKITATSGTIDFDDENIVTTGKATIGPDNTNTGLDAFVAGYYNAASGDRSTIGGGQFNEATNPYATVAGGMNNTASGNAGTVSGGQGNYVTGIGSTIPGGMSNRVDGDFSFAAGRRAKVRDVDDGTFVWADHTDEDFQSTGADQFLIRASGGVGIGTANPTQALEVEGTIFSNTGGFKFPDGTVQTTAATGGGGGWTDVGTIVRLETGTDSVGIGTATPTEKLEVDGNVKASGTITSGTSITIDGVNNKITSTTGTIDFDDDNLVTTGKATIGPGNTNTGTDAFVAGNTNTASGEYSTVGGGYDNTATNKYATVGGGRYNKARGEYSVVCGGGGLSAIDSNSAIGERSAVGGGLRNMATNLGATVGGGGANTASGAYSVVSGGNVNTASGHYTIVGGGDLNTASGSRSTVGGGLDNTASGDRSTIGGGYQNTASGDHGTVPGGYRCGAMGDYSFATGNKAKANHDGSIVIAANSATSSSDSVRSGGSEQMVLRADGGIYITNTSELAPYDASNIITTRGGAYLSGNGTNWTNASDRNLKENFRPVNGQELLEKIAQLPINRWNYKEEDDNITHIGPIAQDFYALFEVGSGDKSISSIDPAGIGLAAIQELYKSTQKQRTEIEQLKAQVNELQKLVQKLLAERETEQSGESQQLGMKR